MRMMRYYVIHKGTKKVVYTECRGDRAQAFLNGLFDKENYTIGYKWLSI